MDSTVCVKGGNSGRIPRGSTSIASPPDPGQLRHSRLHAAARRCSMRNDDRDKTRSDMGNMGNMGSMSDRDRNTGMGSDSSSDFGDESMRNREGVDDESDIDENEEDLQDLQSEGNLGNERVRRSER